MMQRGFSLVEVLLATGVAAFCLITMMGLVPVGLGTMRSAMDETVEAQLVKKLSGEIFLTPYGKLSDEFAGRAFYFGEDGLESSAADARYALTTEVRNPVFPGSSEASADRLSRSLKVVQITVLKPYHAAPEARLTNWHNIQVSNSGN